MTTPCQNPVLPQPTPYGAQRVGEGHRRFAVPVHPALPLRFGREDFSPDFRVTQTTTDNEERAFLIEVKYRPSVEQFISVENQRGDKSIFYTARRQWPNVYFVLVTERPDAGRSCFQTLGFETARSGEKLRTIDLAEVKEFGLFPHNVEDHEELVRRIFALLTS